MEYFSHDGGHTKKMKLKIGSLGIFFSIQIFRSGGRHTAPTVRPQLRDEILINFWRSAETMSRKGQRFVDFG